MHESPGTPRSCGRGTWASCAPCRDLPSSRAAGETESRGCGVTCYGGSGPCAATLDQPAAARLSVPEVGTRYVDLERSGGPRGRELTA